MGPPTDETDSLMGEADKPTSVVDVFSSPEKMCKEECWTVDPLAACTKFF